MAEFEIREEWHAIAAGLLTAWADKLADCTSQADREIQDGRGAWPGWVIAQSYGAMGYTISEYALGLFLAEIPDRVGNPTIRDQIAAGKPPFVQDPTVVGGDWLQATEPGEPVVIMVFKWLNDGTFRWQEIGTLAANPTPSAVYGIGKYVLVNKSNPDDGVLGLPSIFLDITS